MFLLKFSGYCYDKEMLQKLVEIIKELKRRNPSLIYGMVRYKVSTFLSSLIHTDSAVVERSTSWLVGCGSDPARSKVGLLEAMTAIL